MSKPFQILILTIFVCFQTYQMKGQKDTQVENVWQSSSHFPPIAKYPGGIDSLRIFYKKYLNWPSPDFCGEGIVILGLVVEKDGSLSNIEVKRSLCKECDEEALRFVGLMPKWIPGMENGKAVACNMYLPIRFRLE